MLIFIGQLFDGAVIRQVALKATLVPAKITDVYRKVILALDSKCIWKSQNMSMFSITNSPIVKSYSVPQGRQMSLPPAHPVAK
jgi:hypothetical protein